MPPPIGANSPPAVPAAITGHPSTPVAPVVRSPTTAPAGPAAFVPASEPAAAPSASSAFGGAVPVNTVPVGTANGHAPLSGVDLISGDATSPAGSPAYVLPPALKNVVKSADASLNLTVLNKDFNPMKEFTGDLKSPSEIFQGKAVIPTRDIIGGALKSLGPQGAALLGVLDTLPEGSVIRTPAHQFNVDGKPGNRIVGYGGALGHGEIDKVVTALGAEGARVIKQMSHYNGPAQGGKAGAILEDGVGGSTHAGGFSAGFIDGKPTSVKSDWPSDYGRLSDTNEDYNATLYAVDYQGGVKKQIPLETKLAYKHNADMWDAVLGAVVPFAGNDPDPRFSNYKYNPLDLYDQQSAKSIAQDAATLDWSQFSKNHGAFYCAEGQYTVANLGPQEATLLQKSKFGDTTLGKVIDAFAAAPGYAGKDAEYRRTHPDIGWKHLKDSSSISEEQYQRLQDTDRTGTALEWVPESIKGWQAYEPIDPNGLVAKPMTVAGLAWSLLNRYLPREAISNQLGLDLKAGYAKGTPTQQKQIEMMLGGNKPNTPAGTKALADLSSKAATGFISSILANDDFKKNLLHQAGANELLEPTPAEAAQGYVGKVAVEELYGRFVAGLQSAKTQRELEQTLTKLDDEMRGLKIIRAGADPANPRQNPLKGLMLYAAPPAYSSWAQHSVFSGGTSVFKYVAQAMHANQLK